MCSFFIFKGFEMKGYRTATRDDIRVIFEGLISGEKKRVLFRSLLKSEVEAYPVLDICEGPFYRRGYFIEGFSLNGESYSLRIVSTRQNTIEIKKDRGKWCGPEMGSVIILIQE